MSVSATAADIVNQNMFAKQSTKVYAGDLRTVVATIAPGGLIGKVFSYITATDGNIYWMFYLSPQDYANLKPSYVKHNSSTLSVPAYPGIIEKLKEEQEAKEKDEKGALSYYIEKYAPWVVGAVVVAVAAPTILNARRQAAPAVSGLKSPVMPLVLTGFLIYLANKKNEPVTTRSLPTIKIEHQ